MRGRATDCTHLPEDAGNSLDDITYSLTPAGELAVVAARLEAAEIARRRVRGRQARAAGRRPGRIYSRFKGFKLVPELRLCGAWLAAAGFDLGREFEVGVEEGLLRIRVV